MYDLMARTHVWLAQERGQGTVEYVGLILLLAGVLATVVAGAGALNIDIGKAVVGKLKSAIDSVGVKP